MGAVRAPLFTNGTYRYTRRTGSPNNGALCFCRAFFYWKDLFTRTLGALLKWPRRLSTPSPSSRQANMSTPCSLPKQMRNSCYLKCQAWRLGRRLVQKVLLGGRTPRALIAPWHASRHGPTCVSLMLRTTSISRLRVAIDHTSNKTRRSVGFSCAAQLVDAIDVLRTSRLFPCSAHAGRSRS